MKIITLQATAREKANLVNNTPSQELFGLQLQIDSLKAELMEMDTAGFNPLNPEDRYIGPALI